MDREPIGALAALDEPLRRGMYAHIRQARHPVTRDEAAEAVGISRKLAAFHLDKLVDAGLLRTRYEFAGGVRKVGRAPKVYEPSDLEVRVSIPPRHHDVLAEILLDAVLDEGGDETARDAALRTAHRHGERLGAAARAETRPGRLGTERALTLASSIVERHGFEPGREAPTCLRLRNCPFHPLAAKAPDLVCGINQAFMSGLLAGLEARTVEAVLDPRAGECCVELRPAATE
ncbi:helix-turn-helix transcriptional regulator [Amycolatopsis australiensis]|uniref:Predicted transcriptional regulator, ArsR family n=1 Tax=Amycolatopsis australiensis TaxID=546364 RepID=A0A1K1SN34_9PSEU|nr:helix-turn-helix domain-containing protein [Amycolatopsis australiensis]SFW85293.1 Predicted transcriptional regulator, ArsR family [Amycolatopsis australiensis]